MAYAPFAHAETTTTTATSTTETLKLLMAKIAELQAQLATLRGEVRTVIQGEIAEGATSEDIKKIQEVLASDREIYPEGKVTGYFGPLTRQALERFQKKFELEVTGTMNDETRAALEELLEARYGEGKVPPGLLTAPGIRAKFERRLEMGCNNSGKGTAPFCVKMKQKYKFEDKANDDSDDEDDESEDESTDDEDEDGPEIEVEFKNGRAEVKIKYENGVRRVFMVRTTKEDVVIAAIVARTPLTREVVEEVITFEGADEDEDEDEAEDDSDEDDDSEDDDEDEDDDEEEDD